MDCSDESTNLFSVVCTLIQKAKLLFSLHLFVVLSKLFCCFSFCCSADKTSPTHHGPQKHLSVAKQRRTSHAASHPRRLCVPRRPPGEQTFGVSSEDSTAANTRHLDNHRYRWQVVGSNPRRWQSPWQLRCRASTGCVSSSISPSDSLFSSPTKAQCFLLAVSIDKLPSTSSTRHSASECHPHCQLPTRRRRQDACNASVRTTPESTETSVQARSSWCLHGDRWRRLESRTGLFSWADEKVARMDAQSSERCSDDVTDKGGTRRHVVNGEHFTCTGERYAGTHGGDVVVATPTRWSRSVEQESEVVANRSTLDRRETRKVSQTFLALRVRVCAYHVCTSVYAGVCVCMCMQVDPGVCVWKRILLTKICVWAGRAHRCTYWGGGGWTKKKTHVSCR